MYIHIYVYIYKMSLVFAGVTSLCDMANDEEVI